MKSWKQSKTRVAVCYKQDVPTVYNEGTKWETSCSEFVAYYSHKKLEDAQKECDQINEEKPEKLFNGQFARCDSRTYFAVEHEY